jgi:hypothetical protein
MQYVKGELARGLGDWEQRLNTALVPTAPIDRSTSASGPEAHEEPQSANADAIDIAAARRGR